MAFTLLGYFSNWISRSVLADCSKWITASTRGVLRKKCILQVTLNCWTDCACIVYFCINTSPEGTICLAASELWHFCMTSLRAKFTGLQSLPAGCLAFPSAGSRLPKRRGTEGKKCPLLGNGWVQGYTEMSEYWGCPLPAERKANSCMHWQLSGS